MANNRTEAKAAVNSDLVPVIKADILRNTLNNDLLSGIMFDKDTKASFTNVADAITIDFTPTDLITDTILLNAATFSPDITINGLQDGSERTLIVTKTAGNGVTFTNATDLSTDTTNIDDNLTVVVYSVINKNNVIYIKSLNSILEKASNAEAQTGTDTRKYLTSEANQAHYVSKKASQADAETGTEDTKYLTSKTNSDHFVSKKANQATVNAGSDDVKYVTSQKLQSKLVDEFWEDWNNASYGTGWGTGSRALQYRKGIENSVQITGVLSSSGASNIITTLPAGYRPTSTLYNQTH